MIETTAAMFKNLYKKIETEFIGAKTLFLRKSKKMAKED